MELIERRHLRIGQVIAYSHPNTGHVSYGTILHLGLGPTTRNAVWMRCLDGKNKGKVEYLTLEDVRGVIADANR